MKKLLLILIVLFLAGFIAWKFIFNGKKNIKTGPEPEAISVNSTPFNASLSKALLAYYVMAEAFVNWDSATVNKSAAAFLIAMDSLKTDDIKKQVAVYSTVRSFSGMIKTETNSIISEPNWTEKRGSLNTISMNLFDLIRSVQYRDAKVYYQECPMAFGEDKSGNWLSKENKIRNPYLGTNDPQYGNKMLGCGSSVDSVSFGNN